MPEKATGWTGGSGKRYTPEEKRRQVDELRLRVLPFN